MRIRRQTFLMPHETFSSLGEALRHWREQRGLSQGQLAERTRPTDSGVPVDQGYISRLERDLHSPSVEVLCRLAAALDVNPAVLLVCPDEAEPAGAA